MSGNCSSKGPVVAQCVFQELLDILFCANCAPSTVRPCCSGGRAASPTQVSGPNVSVFAGRWPLLFQILVLPWLRRMLACAARWWASRSYTGADPVGPYGDIDVIEKGIQMCSPGWSWAWTACRAGYCPRENRAGMRGSPCSPPSAYVMEWCMPDSSCQTYSDSVAYHKRT